MISTRNPRTGSIASTGIEETTAEQVAEVATVAQRAQTALTGLGRYWRADLLDGLAGAVEQHREELVSVADEETALGAARLNAELTRSADQFRMFAGALRDGGYLEAAIDHASGNPVGALPDVRRMLVPIGPVAVFGASNFPFAFSVLGGDTASALAAGCPVLLKAHSSHPLTSQRTFRVLAAEAERRGAPAGTLSIVFGTSAGRSLVADPNVKAVSFTGSLSGGRALMNIINQREEPIPFYGELSSVNPLIVTEGAAAVRSDEIARGLFESFTGSAGQLCTKPGVAFVPRAATRLLEAITRLVRATEPVPLLNARITKEFRDALEQSSTTGRTTVAATGATSGGSELVVTPTILTTDAASLTSEVAEETFGPVIVLALYDDIEEVVRALATVPKSLTATLHSEVEEMEVASRLSTMLLDRAGRLVFNGYPTGVRVSWAQHHGGPWPATSSIHTSVGVTAVRRFLRPLAWQNAQEQLLPEELRDAYDRIPRRVDGELVPAAHQPRRSHV